MNVINTNPSTKKEKGVKVLDDNRIKRIDKLCNDQLNNPNNIANDFVMKIYDDHGKIDDDKEEKEEEEIHPWRINCYIAVKFIHTRNQSQAHYECLRMFDFKSNALSINTFQRRIQL
jgi:hypothetical protein